MAGHIARSRTRDAAAVAAPDIRKTVRYCEPSGQAGQKKQAAVLNHRPSHRNSTQHRVKKVNHRASPVGISRKKPVISTATFFKKDRRIRREKEKTPELISQFEDGLKDAREAIGADTNSTFQKVHSAFNQRIHEISHGDKEFFDAVSERAKLLTAPLPEERVETEVRRDGKPFHEIIEIGRQVDTFRKIIDKEEAKLADLWEQWDALQNEYIKLGAGVFGAEAFGELGVELEGQGGYRREMEMLELEHSTKVKEVDEEIENIGVNLLAKMKTKEKQLDAAAKKEQAQLLQSIMNY